jgi:hypothetical protein
VWSELGSASVPYPVFVLGVGRLVSGVGRESLLDSRFPLGCRRSLDWYPVMDWRLVQRIRLSRLRKRLEAVLQDQRTKACATNIDRLMFSMWNSSFRMIAI